MSTDSIQHYVFPPPPMPSLPVTGRDEVIPIRRIYCVGRNYAAHAVEMGSDPDREPPFFFAKPADAIVAGGGKIPYPPLTEDLQHEMELVVVLGSGGRDIPMEQAFDHVFGYAAGLDMTRRDLQAEAKKTGRPWDMGKGFDYSAPCSPVRPASEIGHPAEGAIWLKVNGATRQSGDLNQQIWKVEEAIAYLSRFVALAAGDLIFTGTPAGVGRVVRGDRLEGHIDRVGDISVLVE
ncbi:MAG: fumarylacetoacetate hydrolase family protein [Acidiferrobacterales bacterium]